jgi:peptide/nickel transport system substrate-binding protein
MRPAARLAAALIGPCLLLAACGEGGATRFSGEDRLQAGGGGTLTLALPQVGLPADPLLAGSASQQWIARQLYEPLIDRIAGPYGRPAANGLALTWQRSRDLRVWTFLLRPGVRFRDGTLLDGAAIRANAERWAASEVGAGLLPGLIAADAPRPNIVRLIFSEPFPGLPRRLGDPRLGIVSESSGTGSGPFALTSSAPGRIVLERWDGWWGSSHGLGPALDSVVFERVRAPQGRLDALRAGGVRVAAELGPGETASVRRNPLLAVVGSAADGTLAIERSVRGIGDAEPQSLAGVWLTLIDPER